MKTRTLLKGCFGVVSGLMIVLVSSSWGRAEGQAAPASGSQIPLPPGFATAKSMMGQVDQADNLPAEAKKVVREQFQYVEAQFNQVWKPLQDVYDGYLTKLGDLRRDESSLAARIEAHNRKPQVFRLPEQQGAYDQYNAEAGQLNSDKAELAQNFQQTNEKANKDWAEKVKDVDTWLSGPSLKQFTHVAERLLSGKVIFRKGQAWNDLVRAASAGQNSGPVFDGGPSKGPGGNNGNGVDARDQTTKEPVVPKGQRTPAIRKLEQSRNEAKTDLRNLMAERDRLSDEPRSAERDMRLAEVKQKISSAESLIHYYNVKITDELRTGTNRG
jgi:hypothetical protein